MVSDYILWWRTTTKSDGIGRILWSTGFYLCGHKQFRPAPYYAAWNHPHLIILSAFYLSHSLKFEKMFYQSITWSQDCSACLAPQKPNNFDIYFTFFKDFELNGKKKIIIKYLLTKNQTWQPTLCASECRTIFGILWGFFLQYGASIIIGWLKIRLNLIIKGIFWLFVSYH